MSNNITMRDDLPVCAECAALRHDIERHVEITAQQAQEVEELRADLAAARAMPTALSDGYLSGTVSGSETAHSIRLHYRSRRQAEKAFHALTDAIDAAIAGERKP